MNKTADPLDAESNNEFEELNNLISSTVFSSISSIKGEGDDEDNTTNDSSTDAKEDIEWSKISNLFHSNNNMFLFPLSSKESKNSSSISNASTSNESQLDKSPESSPELSSYKQLFSISPLNLNSSSYIMHSSYVPINKYDEKSQRLQMPYYSIKHNPQKGLDSEKSIIHLNDIINKKDTRTTLMIRHIPNKYTLKLFTNEINQKFKNKYDVFYLPIDYVNNCNLGFAFINFVDPLHVVEFYEAFRGKKWKKYYSDKICELAYAKIQGKQNLIVHFEKGSVLNYQTEEKKPLILPTPEKLPKINLPIKFFDNFKESFPQTPYTQDKEKKHIVFENSLIN